MAAARVVPAFDVVKDGEPGVEPGVANRSRSSSSASSVAQTLSPIAWSSASPTEPIDGCTPASRRRWPNAIEVYWQP
jgi:hypothetical protein